MSAFTEAVDHFAWLERVGSLASQDDAHAKALVVGAQHMKKLIDFVRQVESGFDCDEDAHRYRTFCRACKAKEVLKEIGE